MDNFVLKRFHPDGSPDTTFNSSVVSRYSREVSWGWDFFVQEDDTILALDVNWVQDQRELRRYLADGTPDTTFHVSSHFLAMSQVPRFTPTNQGIWIYGAGGWIQRLLPNGQIDQATSATMQAALDTTIRYFISVLPKYIVDERVEALTTDESGRLILALSAPVVTGDMITGYSTHHALVRLGLDGKMESFQNIGIFDAPIHALLAQPDGSIVAGGGFSKIDGQPYYHLARFVPPALKLGVSRNSANGVVELQLAGGSQKTVVIEATSTLSPAI